MTARPHDVTVDPRTLEQVTSLVGERTVPDLWHENYWFRRHEAAYLDLAPLVVSSAGDGVIVEAGSGEGYGVRLLAGAGAHRLLALDYDAASTAHAARRYPEAGVARCNLAALPLADASVAAITCMQVIEHLWTPWEFLGECARVLAPGGVLVVTTPNRPVFSPGLARGEHPPNPFHVREFDVEELVDTIAAHLPVESVSGLVHGERIRAWERAHPSARGDIVQAQLATTPDDWEPDLAALVPDLVAGDFTIGPLERTGHTADDVHDLIVIARRALA